MILGIGADIIELERVSAASAGFIARVYTETEAAGLSQNPARRAEQLAGMFAVKEAVAKALGSGFGRVSPRDIELTHTAKGRPSVKLLGGAKELAESLGVINVHVSISHCTAYAVAYAVAEG